MEEDLIKDLKEKRKPEECLEESKQKDLEAEARQKF